MNARLFPALAVVSLLGLTSCGDSIDRQALVSRHNPCVEAFDPLASLSVGNGGFAVTLDATSLQSFPELYAKGVPLGTQSQWGWHSFPNFGDYRLEETFKPFYFHGHEEWYACQFRQPGRQKAACDYFRANPHRLHLGYTGLEFRDGETCLGPEALQGIRQELDMWNGVSKSDFRVLDQAVEVSTFCHPKRDALYTRVSSPLLGEGNLRLRWSFPYPTGGHADDASRMDCPERHQTRIVEHQRSFEGKKTLNRVVLERGLDGVRYYVTVSWTGEAEFEASDNPHVFYLTAAAGTTGIECCTEYSEALPQAGLSPDHNAVRREVAAFWNGFWKSGGAVDFSACTDPRASELERRVVLSQYLTALQCAGEYPPQETGLTYNSWYGKFHLEMHWWHAVHFALWGRSGLMAPQLDWYAEVEPIAAEIARRQGYEGVRWMKMTDPTGIEAPSNVGSFLLWQQPHYIYLAELLYRANPSREVLEHHASLVMATARFLASFIEFDAEGERYIIRGVIPAQETLKAAETVNPPLELSSCRYALKTAQAWRVRLGLEPEPLWDDIVERLSPLAMNEDSLYLAAETALDSYTNLACYSDHMAVLGALGMMPASPLVQPEVMSKTLDWILANWNWDKTWGWDYPMTAFCAARLGRPADAVDALLLPLRTNTYLVNGHNYQDDRLRLYLPGNGGLLSAVAMMCAGWDDCPGVPGQNGVRGGYCPGFPQDGTWKVKWEGLQPMP